VDETGDIKYTPLRTSVCLYVYIQSSESGGPTLNGNTHNTNNNKSRNRLVTSFVCMIIDIGPREGAAISDSVYAA